MKKIILTLSLLLSINLYATDKAECKELFKGAIYNFYLENSCKYNKHVSSSLRKVFGDKNCTELFSDSDMKDLNSEVLGSSYQKMKSVGKENFCKNNRAKYDALASDLSH